jgi:hypothetical protein
MVLEVRKTIMVATMPPRREKAPTGVAIVRRKHGFLSAQLSTLVSS